MKTKVVDIQTNMEISLIERMENFYKDAMSRGDKRTEKWLLMETPLAATLLLIAYILIVIFGPKLMAKRKPFQLKWTIFVYNCSLVALSIYMFTEILVSSIKSNYSYTCQPVDYSDSPLAMRMARVQWWFFFSKIIEFLDTIFFILRKKNDQISFLHVFHHCSMIFSWWIAVKYVAGGQSFFLSMINSFVHIIMYSYYALSTFGPKMQKYLWWKRHITKLQLAQFWLILAHTSYNLYIDCDFPDSVNKAGIAFDVAFIVLFANFYFRAYTLKQRDNRTRSVDTSNKNGKMKKAE